MGINTTSPKSTLDIVGKNDTKSPDGILIPRCMVSELSAKDSLYGNEQNGTLIFITSGTGASGKTSDITGPGLYYYDSPSSKWKAAGGGTFNITLEQTSSYVVKSTDNFIKLNINSSGHTLTLPVTGVSIGKKIYVSNIGKNGIDISPLPRNTSYTQVQAGITGALIYLGGSGNGSWDWVTGF